ncbi:MAG: antibiotic biosynthesis monooxygenase [Gammaproteobacteria bacterium]|nr:antibiotic biosynthesis monooxygenase [Gammaproteobacteria bacterium]
MYVSIVTLRIKREHLGDFLAAVKRNHAASVLEPGNLRFDVLRAVDEPTRFVLYEAYTSAEAAAAHRRTPHFQAWQDTVYAWFAAPREAEVFDGLHPATTIAAH